MNEQERIAAFVTLHGLEISLEAGLEKIRELRKQFEALEPKAPGSSGLSTPTAPTTPDAPIKGKRRAGCLNTDCPNLHWNGYGALCSECYTKIAKS